MGDNYRVVLSVHGKYHAFAIASSLEKMGILYKFITTLFIPYSFAKKNFLPQNIKKRFLSRTEEQIDAKKVIPLVIPYILGKFGKYSKNLGFYRLCVSFDALATLVLKSFYRNFQIIHGWDSSSYMQFKNFTNTKKVLELVQSLPEIQYEALKFELKRWKIHGEPNYYWPSLARDLPTRRMRELEMADVVIVPSSFLAQQLKQLGMYDKVKINPYYSAVRPKDTICEKINNKKFTVLNIAPITLLKGTLYLLEACKIAKRKIHNLELIIVGKLDERLKPIISKIDFEFKHFNYIPHIVIDNIYDNADIYVMSSLAEGSSLTIYEAMARGLPTIATQESGSIIEHEVNGLIVPARDSVSLAQAIIRLCEDNILRYTLGANACNTIKQGYTVDHYERRAQQIYSSVL